MTSIQFFVQPLPGSDDQFIGRLREVSDKINKYGHESSHSFENLTISVKELVIGPTHIGILLEDGKAFRVAFSINSDRLDLDLSKAEATASTLNNTSPNTTNSKNSSSASRQLARSRARLMRSTGRSGGPSSGSRSSGVIIGGTSSGRPLVAVPAPYVPEELISQAEVVLQGKSRNLIIRELQRTNLDVNLAVNNLLSRDDEEVEDTEEGPDNYVPEDLISLLDNGFHADNSSVIIDPTDGLFSEEIFSNYSSIRNLLFNRIRSERNQPNSPNSEGNQPRPSTSTNALATGNNPASQTSSVNADREAFSKWRDRQYYGPRRWISKDESSWDKDADTKKKDTNVLSSPVWISDDMQPWPEMENNIRFKKISALYSEFIGLSVHGELHQWRWADNDVYKSVSENIFHPKTRDLNIFEKVDHLSASFIRCSIVTETHRIATWMDEHLGYLGAKLEHCAMSFSEFLTDRINSIYTCSLYTAVRTENNNVYWWGMLPFDQRQYLWNKFRTKAKKPVKIIASDISVGSQVVMKKCPIFQMGSMGFTCASGVPKIGQLLNSVWDFGDICRIKLLNASMQTNDSKEQNKTLNLVTSTVLNKQLNNSNKESTDRLDMPPPPSPASSTCSDSGSCSSLKRPKRMAPKDDIDGRKEEEIWQLKDVAFIEDKIGPVGKVLKVDGDFVAVQFNFNILNADPKEDDWQHCRLLKKDDVQVIKPINNTRGPDCFQKHPKKINIIGNDGNNFQLLAVAVDFKGIHVLKRLSSKLHYSLYNLYNSKLEQNCIFPTDCNAFIGLSLNNIEMFCNNDSSENSTILLRDGNRNLYPIAKDCVGCIKDPQWFDLPPIKNISMSTIALPLIGNNLKSKVCMTALVVESQKLMPLILRCDVTSVIVMLNNLEKEHRDDIITILNERCDGGRNIYHACTVMCSPTSNKDYDDNRKKNFPAISHSISQNASTLSTSNADNINPLTFVQSNARDGKTVSLREMMNRLINTDSDKSNTVSSTNLEDHLLIPMWAEDIKHNTDDKDTKMSGPKYPPPIYVIDPIQRRENAILILQQMCLNSILRSHLQNLLSSKDAQGQTPFMLSIASRAYEAGVILLNTILSISENGTTCKDSMIFPNGSAPDHSPLYVICYNDTCSFTWTGADHINQNIFECKTCGLTGSLCCCTECARVCHKGHDCKLKRTSPTAYCDCWEKCKCKALIAGNQNKRYLLLCKLAAYTDLVTKFNSKSESILLFLIQTVGRQAVEQRQYRANSRLRNTNSGTRKTTIEVDSDMPEHDLEPPRFARRALERLLSDWLAVKSMIMTGAEIELNKDEGKQTNDSTVQYQSGTTLLDKFTHNLFVKCSIEHVDILLSTLTKEIQINSNSLYTIEAEIVVRRFVRSVARVFVIFNLEKFPNPEKRKSSICQIKHIQNCIKVFHALPKISIEELCEVAEALIAPVRLGVVRPTAPFAMSSSNIDNSDDLFCVEPMTPYPTENLDNKDTGQASPFNLQSDYGLLNIDETNELDTIGDVSEQDDVQHRDNNSQTNDEDDTYIARHEEGIQDDESDTEFNFNEGETESDSDDNQSGQDAPRSVQTGGTVGLETGMDGVLFPEDESGDSSPQDDDGSEEDGTDEHSDEFNVASHQLERRNLNNISRGDSASHSMQWAIRNRDSGRSSVRLPTGSSLVFIDPTALRRTNIASNSAVTTHSQEHHTMATTACNLARAFGIIIRQISELLSSVTHMISVGNEIQLKLTNNEAIELQAYVETSLKSTWDWMFSVMDGTEAQLKFGAYLTNCTNPTHPLHPLNQGSKNSNPSVAVNLLGTSSRREFFTYCLSLMRAHTSEHRDALPVLDVTALRHIAYVLDGFIFYMRNETQFFEKMESDKKYCNKNDVDKLLNFTPDNVDEESFTHNIIGNRNTFFKRSESTLSLGCLAPDFFEVPVDISLPLADKPHLLQPNARREDLFANLPLPIAKRISNCTNDKFNILHFLPSKLGLSDYQKSFDQNKLHKKNIDPLLNASNDTNSLYIQEKKNFTNVLGMKNKSEGDFQQDDEIRNTTGMDKKITSSQNTTQAIKNSVQHLYNITSFPPRGNLLSTNNFSESPSWNMLLGRWKLSMDLFGRVFVDDVGMEQGSVLSELRGFPVKETRFRRNMEKLRNGQQRDLILSKLERNRDSLIIQTFKELNSQFGSQNRRVLPPLTFNRVKVTFKDEPGEGSGVARSFYTSISEALLSSEKMPNLERVQIGSTSKYGVPFSSILKNRSMTGKDSSSLQRRGTGSKILWRATKEKKLMNFEAQPFSPTANAQDSSGNLSSNDHLSVHLQQLGNRLFPKVYSINATNASKITGMLLEIPSAQLLSILSSEDTLRQKVNEALDLIVYRQKMESGTTPTTHQGSTSTKKMIPVVLLEHCQVEDNEPLFYSPGKRGFYSPRQGYGSFERINAFRNIGRLIGLCLLQNELLPLYLQRHVLKYILGRQIKFHDLAFFDPTVYESLRQIINASRAEDGVDMLNRLDLFFVVDLLKEEGGGSIDLLPGGKNIQVTVNNMYEYVMLYTEYRLIKSQEKALEAIKDGVFDVLPENSMDGLTAEDVRLLLNGVGEINVSTLISYTSFNDESSEGSDKLFKFKRWFWNIVEKINTSERQDLIYFWTGSPALPASEEGFQPLPSITIRPADDSHLPTANTCISRLYIPLYTSKSILRSKLLLAIKSKNFGFV